MPSGDRVKTSILNNTKYGCNCVFTKILIEFTNCVFMSSFFIRFLLLFILVTRRKEQLVVQLVTANGKTANARTENISGFLKTETVLVPSPVT